MTTEDRPMTQGHRSPAGIVDDPLDTLSALEAAATPGPWHHYRAPSLRRGMGGSPVNEVQGPSGGSVVKWTGFDAADGTHGQRRADAALIAAARNALPALLTIAVAAREWAEFMDAIGSPHTAHDQKLVDAVAAFAASTAKATLP